MKTLSIAGAGCAALLLAAGAVAQSGGDARPIPALKNLSETETKRCVPFHRVTDIRPEAGVLLFREGRGRVYVNVPTRGCEYGIRANDIVATRTLSGEYCEGDAVRMRRRTGGQLSGACSLGAFKVFEAPAAAH